MATVTKKLPNGIADSVGAYLQVSVADIVLSSSYSAGGESVTASDFGFLSGYTVISVTVDPASGYVPVYNRSTSKLQVYVPGVAIAAAGAATIDDFALTGTGASTARSIGLDSASTSPVRFGPLQEVAATVNLSSVTFRAYAVAALI